MNTDGAAAALRPLRVFVYKRTHTGDPCERGVFGCADCMGSLRNWNFDAAIGIGGLNPWPGCEGIRGKVNWIGIGRHQVGAQVRSEGKRPNAMWAFAHFGLMDGQGPVLADVAPALHRYLFDGRCRFFIVDPASHCLPSAVLVEVRQLLDWAMSFPPSPVLQSRTRGSVVRGQGAGTRSCRKVSEVHHPECATCG